MTRGRGRAIPSGTLGRLLLLLLFTSGCVYYPTVADVGGVRLQPERGRVVRSAEGALFFADINNTGMFEDVLVRVETPVAKHAQLVGPSGAPLASLVVPGTSQVRLHPTGERVALSDLTRELKSGEVVIVTLHFSKSGALGVVSSVE